MRKKRYEQSVVQKILLDWTFLVGIHQVGELREGVEGNPQRKHNPDKAEAEAADVRGDGLNEQCVLEEEQQPKVESQSDKEPRMTELPAVLSREHDNDGIVHHN